MTRQKSTPPVGLEPTTARLRAARSTDWARKATDIIHITSLFYHYYHQSTWIHDYMTIPIYRYIITDTWLHAYMTTCVPVYVSLWLYAPTYPMLMFLSFYFLTAADDYPLLLYFSPYYFLDLTHSVFSTCWYMLLPTLCSLSSSSTFFYPRIRKLPWLSRQSDRLLTDRSLVRSQAEAPFLLFPYSLHIYIWLDKKVRLPWVSNPRPRG